MKRERRVTARKRVPYTLTQACYRELIEDWHAEQIQLNMAHYENLKKKCAEQLSGLIRDIEEVKQAGGLINTTGMLVLAHKNSFLVYFLEYYYSDLDWTPPEFLEIPLPISTPEACAEFVLGGVFLEACKNHDRLTDRMMKWINIDVHNRFFTLTEAGIIPLPLRTQIGNPYPSNMAAGTHIA